MENAPKHSNGGIVGGTSYYGDKMIARVNSGEMILNPIQQYGLFSFISNTLRPKPVGEKEYIYTPSSKGNGVTELSVRDINVNVNGTIKLDTGTLIKDIDISTLLKDSSFISSLKDLIKESINNDINNGRFMKDIASMRGMPSQVGLWGRK
jgi:hypothetical protein